MIIQAISCSDPVRLSPTEQHCSSQFVSESNQRTADNNVCRIEDGFSFVGRKDGFSSCHYATGTGNVGNLSSHYEKA
jgi:hypothetical protein